MSESEEERERIRQQKRKELLDNDGPGGTDADGAPSEPIEIADQSQFQSVLDSNHIVLVDCYADWCGPCKMMEPVVTDLATRDDVAVAKIDVDRHQGLAAELGAQSIPTFIVYVDGEPTERLVGAQDQATFEQLFDKLG